ncbi:MAG: MAPEG family protein [Rhodospirillales bacterium]
MTVAIWCLLLFLIVSYGVRWWSIKGAIAQDGSYDNSLPRQQQARLTGLGARAQAAHQNSLEAFAPFAAAVILAQSFSSLDVWRDGLAIAFVALRLLYVLAYLRDWGNGRSMIWAAAFIVNLALFLLPAFG